MTVHFSDRARSGASPDPVCHSASPLDSGVSVAYTATRTAEAAVAADLEIQRHEADVSATKRRARIDLDGRQHAARVEAELAQAVETLAAQLRPRRAQRPRAPEPPTAGSPNGRTGEAGHAVPGT